MHESVGLERKDIGGEAGLKLGIVERGYAWTINAKGRGLAGPRR
jgi:hypothetical protein